MDSSPSTPCDQDNENRAPVSVIIPCFNCSGTICRAVESIFAQSRRPSEIILVDDASQDDTLSKIKKIAQKYGPKLIKIISLSENRGPALARNRGWDIAENSYIAFLDADDSWHPKKIEIQYGFMQRHPEIALSGHSHCKCNPESVDAALVVQEGYAVCSKFQLLLSNPFITPSVMLKRDLPVRFDPHRRHMEDHLLWLQVIFNGYPIARLNACLACIYKKIYGARGLSSDLLEMEKGDLYKYWFLYKAGHIPLITTFALFLYSILKYIKRLFMVSLQMFFGKS